MTRSAEMSEHFASYLRRMGLEAVSFDFDKEKPDTLSFELASFVEQVSRFTQIKAVNSRQEPLALHVGVTGELNSNAFADVFDNHHYIGITLGHFLSSSYFSIQAFFMTKAFQDIGTAPENANYQLELCPEHSFWDLKGASTIEEFGTVKSADRARIFGAYFLTYAMTMLTFHHEFFHIYLGHCPIMNRLGLRGRLLEVGTADLPDGPDRISRSLETVADQSSIILLIKMILADHDLPTIGKVTDLSITDRLRLMLVGAGLQTTSWFAWQKRANLKASSHPDPGARLTHFYCTTKDTLEALGQGNLFLEAASKAMEDLAMIAFRCDDLKSTMFSIANGPPRSQSIEKIPPDIMEMLEEECFRSV